VLSETTKSYIRAVAKQDFYGYNVELNNKYINKGIMQENDSIALFNTVHFTNYSKNTERLNNEWLTGEADIVLDDQIVDIKTSWSLETFPATSEEGVNKDYEWQLRAYMMLYNKNYASLVYCMVSTHPSLLNEWENLSLHQVDHIAPEKRITTLLFTRDLDLEVLIKIQLHHCTEYYVKYINQLNNK
jgi:hypothetical protein